MSVESWTEHDRLSAEDSVQFCAENLRTKPTVRPVLIDRWKKTIVNEMLFLKEWFPESEILKMDFSDLNL